MRCGRIRVMIGRKYLQPALVDKISTVGDGKKMKRGRQGFARAQ